MDSNHVVDPSSNLLDIKEFQSTEAQKGLFFRCQLDPNNPAYNISCSYQLQGVIDLGALEKSIGSIVDRHDSLRTRFKLQSTGLIQVVAPTATTDPALQSAQCANSVNHLEVKELPSWASQRDIDQLLNDEINNPFDLDGGVLFRCVLLSDSKRKEHLFIFVVHHLIFDHSSKSIFNYELSEIYNHFAHGRSLQLQALEHQFSDYVNLKDQKMQSAVIDKQHRYWQKKLDGLEPPAVPLDRPRNAPPSSNGVRIERDLPKSLVDSIKGIASEHHSTLFIATLAVAKVLVSRWTGEDDISIGTHYADRRYPGGDSMMGFLLNTLVLRSDLSQSQTFSELLNAVQKTCFQAYRYSDIPFERLVETLLIDRNYERNPFFDVRFTHLKDHEHQLDLEQLDVNNVDLEECRARYDLTLTLLEKNNGYRIQIEYRSALFDRSKMEWLLGKYIELLELISSNPHIPLKEISLVDDGIKRTLLDTFNRTDTPFPKEKAIHQLISEQVDKTPKAVAIRYLQQQKTYEELEADTNLVARYLHSMGVSYGSVVAVSIDRSIDMVIALLGVLKAGATYLPIDHNYPADRIQHMIDDSGCEYVVTESKIVDSLPKNNARIIQLDADWEKISTGSSRAQASAPAEQSNPPSLSPVDTDSPAYIIYTSGSTGKPKGVLVTHKNVVNFLSSMRKVPGLSSGDKLVAVTTLSFDIAVLEIWLPLICGATTIIAGSGIVSDGEQLKALVENEHANVMQATPISWRLLLGAGWQGGDSFKALCGGEAMPPDLAIELHDKVGELWNMYGPTETTVWSSCCKIDNPLEPIHIGAPIDNTTFYILNKDNQLITPGAAGELFIGGDGVTAGYHNRQELTTEKFIPNPFKPHDRLYATGDAARFSAAGNVEFIARIDNQVKIRGLRIELGEIESQLNAHRDVIQSVVVVREDTPGDQRIVAYYESHEGAPASTSSLRDTLKQGLPHYMIPQQWVHLDRLPLTPNGKLDRKSLPAVTPDAESKSLNESGSVSSLPATALEKKMAGIWSDVLNVESVPVDATFFDLGGHSLLAMQVIARSRQDLSIDINPMAMVSGTLRELVHEYDSDAIKEPNERQKGSQLETFFFNNNELYGRLDKPNPSQSSRGAVLLCNPLYIESNNIHWGYRRLAASLCAAGFYVLRFDYFGTGNSLGEDDEGNVEKWSEDITAAARELLSRSGHSSLSVVGFRYGATLGSLLERIPLDTFVLWEPVTDSVSHVTDLENKYHASVAEINEFAADQRVAEANELSGYRFSEKARQSIVDTELQIDKLINQCQNVVLVTSENLEKYQSIKREIKNIFVDDHIPSIESMLEPSIWLPGKSLSEIVKVLESHCHA